MTIPSQQLPHLANTYNTLLKHTTLSQHLLHPRNTSHTPQIHTAVKCCCVYLSAFLNRSRHACVSANARIPRQFDGSSCFWRKSQQTSCISASCSRQAAGRSVCTLLSSTTIADV